MEVHRVRVVWWLSVCKWRYLYVYFYTVCFLRLDIAFQLTVFSSSFSFSLYPLRSSQQSQEVFQELDELKQESKGLQDEIDGIKLAIEDATYVPFTQFDFALVHAQIEVFLVFVLCLSIEA